MWCDQASLKSKNRIFFKFFLIWHFLLGYCLRFNLVKTPQRLGNWFQRYKQLKDWTNNKKQKKLLALFGSILICKFQFILLDHITYLHNQCLSIYIAHQRKRQKQGILFCKNNFLSLTFWQTILIISVKGCYFNLQNWLFKELPTINIVMIVQLKPVNRDSFKLGSSVNWHAVLGTLPI